MRSSNFPLRAAHGSRSHSNPATVYGVFSFIEIFRWREARTGDSGRHFPMLCGGRKCGLSTKPFDDGGSLFQASAFTNSEQTRCHESIARLLW
jgi:hypothetical protein